MAESKDPYQDGGGGSVSRRLSEGDILRETCFRCASPQTRGLPRILRNAFLSRRTIPSRRFDLSVSKSESISAPSRPCPLADRRL